MKSWTCWNKKMIGYFRLYTKFPEHFFDSRICSVLIWHWWYFKFDPLDFWSQLPFVQWLRHDMSVICASCRGIYHVISIPRPSSCDESSSRKIVQSTDHSHFSGRKKNLEGRIQWKSISMTLKLEASRFEYHDLFVSLRECLSSVLVWQFVFSDVLCSLRQDFNTFQNELIVEWICRNVVECSGNWLS